MKKIKLFSCCFLLFFSFPLLAQNFSDQAFQSTINLKEGTATVCFTPGGNCTEAIINEINKAKQTLLIQAYSFTSAPIAKAILDAFKRGVKIQIILDKSQKTQKYSEGDFFVHAGIPTFIDDQHAIAHNKVILIDSNSLITGSFNFTKAAQERNAENILILHDPILISFYKKNWKSHFQHSIPY